MFSVAMGKEMKILNASKLKHLVMVNNFLLANRTQAPFEILNGGKNVISIQSLICFSFAYESFSWAVSLAVASIFRPKKSKLSSC